MKYKFALCLLFGGMVCLGDAPAQVINYDMHGGVWVPSDETEITAGATIMADRVDISQETYIKNYGAINSDIFVADYVELYLQNFGVVGGSFHLGTDAQLIQVIGGDGDVTQLTGVDNYVILVNGVGRLNWNSVIDVAKNASTIKIENSGLVLDTKTNQFDGQINLDGRVVVYMDADNLHPDIPVMENVVGDVQIVVNVDGINPLYTAVGSIEGGNLYVKTVRESSYEKIMKNDFGRFLDKQRGHDKKLLRALDGASDIDGINNVLAHSVRMKPVRLMDAVRTSYVFTDLFDNVSRRSGVYGAADYLWFDFGDMENLRLRTDVELMCDTELFVSGNVGMFNVSDDINEFSGESVGLDVGVLYDNGLILGRVMAGGGAAWFDIGDVWAENKIVKNPIGFAMHMVADVGLRLFDNSAWDIVSVIGVISNGAMVANKTDFDTRGNLGMSVAYHVNDWNAHYTYGVRGGVLSQGAGYLDLMMGMELPDDNIIGMLSVGTVRDVFGTSYRISVNAKYLF